MQPMQNNRANSRALSIDALRGLALFGILAVNIQSFVWGLSGPTLGILDADSSTADSVTVFLTALLLEYKFYPIFCFCFGYGFAVQTRRWLAAKVNAYERFGKRLNVMLVFGALHGIFFYFGDILSRYAVTGYILRRYIGYGPRRLLGAAKFWLRVTVIVTVFAALLSFSASFFLSTSPTDVVSREDAIIAEINKSIGLYTTGNYGEITAQRFQNYLEITLGFVFYIPQLLLIFLLGAFTAKMGWLAQPRAHCARWKKILLIALMVGIPLNCFYAWGAMELARDPGAAPGFLHSALSGFIPILAFAYIACIALAATSKLGEQVLGVFAAAGKMALTNYLLQSLIVSTLLYGYGFALGDDLTQFQLWVLAVSIYTMQLVFSNLYLRYFSIGPMEILWRKLSASADKNIYP